MGSPDVRRTPEVGAARDLLEYRAVARYPTHFGVVPLRVDLYDPVASFGPTSQRDPCTRVYRRALRRSCVLAAVVSFPLALQPDACLDGVRSGSLAGETVFFVGSHFDASHRSDVGQTQNKRTSAFVTRV